MGRPAFLQVRARPIPILPLAQERRRCGARLKHVGIIAVHAWRGRKNLRIRWKSIRVPHAKAVGVLTTMVVWCQLGGILFAAVAAIFWFQSAGIPMAAVAKMQRRGPAAISDVIGRQARLNGLAASCAAVSFFLQALATYLAM